MYQGKSELLERIERIDDDKRATKYRNAVNELAELLDESQVFEQYHPLQPYLQNTAQHSVNRISELIDMIRNFSDDEIFQDEILPRLNIPNEYFGARLELEIANLVEMAGYSVDFVPPDPQNAQQRPDLRVEGSLPLEITRLGTPEHISEQSRRYNEISNALLDAKIQYGINYAGSLSRELSEPAKDELLTQIEEAISDVRDGKFTEIRRKSLGEIDYEIALAPENEEEQLQSWKEEYDITGALTGVPQSKNEPIRIKGKLEQKVQQLPSDIPGAVLISVNLWTISGNTVETYLELARTILKDVYNHSNLSSLILKIRSRTLDQESLDVEVENVRISDIQPPNASRSHRFLIIHNRYVEDAGHKQIVDSIFS